jgi:hypothetical protein
VPTFIWHPVNHRTATSLQQDQPQALLQQLSRSTATSPASSSTSPSYCSSICIQQHLIRPTTPSSMPQLSNPIRVLNLCSDRCCVGWAPSKGRKCTYRINKNNVASVRSILAAMVQQQPNADLLHPSLVHLAQHSLCLYRCKHQDQIPDMVQQWVAAIRAAYPSPPPASGILRAVQRASPVASPAPVVSYTPSQAPTSSAQVQPTSSPRTAPAPANAPTPSNLQIANTPPQPSIVPAVPPRARHVTQSALTPNPTATALVTSHPVFTLVTALPVALFLILPLPLQVALVLFAVCAVLRS